LRQKSWQLSGEVLASARPENSLLAEALDFEYMTRQGVLCQQCCIAIMNAAAVMLLKFISYIKSVFISKYCHGKEMV